METHENEDEIGVSTLGVSTFISKSSGRVKNQHSLLHDAEREQQIVFDQQLEDVVNELNAPAVHCYVNKSTGERTSFSTRVHNYGGGFAVTRRESKMPGSELDGKQLFGSTTMNAVPHGIQHVFRLARRYPSARFVPIGETDDFQQVPYTVDEFTDAADPPMLQQLVGPSPQLPAVAQEHRRTTRKYKQRTRGREPKLSEEQLFANAINLHAGRTAFLSHALPSNLYIRSHHLFTKNRTLAYMSAFFSSERGPKAIVSVLWETKKKPHYAVTVNLSIPQESNSIVANCSCDYLITQTKDTQPSCVHAQVVLHNEGFIQQVVREIRRRQEVPNIDHGSTIFGNSIDISSTSDVAPHLTTFLERDTNKQRTLSHPWMFFVVLDPRLQLFIPLVKVFGKGMQCMGCRLSPVMGGNCSHVEACLNACRALHVERRITLGAAFLTEVGITFNRDESGNDSDRTWLPDDDVYGSDSDNEMNQGGNRSVEVPEIYYPTTFTRRILPCPGELQCMKEIARKLEELPPGEFLALDDRETVSCHKCGSMNTKPRYPGYRREVVLFTLAQGSPRIDIYDWYCDVCGEKRLFTGKTSGVFPARKKICYTTELMYLLLEMTCTNALSFRTAYRITRLFERTLDATRLRSGKKYEHMDNRDEGNRSRRRTNEAFRAFVKHLDTSSVAITSSLFSCDNCETPVTRQDCEELNMRPETSSGMKRLQAIVVDGTAAGILTKLPNYDRHIAVVPPAEGGLGSVCLVGKAKHRKMLTKFFSMWRNNLRKWKSSSIQVSNTEGQNQNLVDYALLMFWLRNPTKSKLPGVMSETPLMDKKDTDTMQLYINKNACFCPVHIRRGQYTHTVKCRKIRTSFSKASVASEIHDLFRQLFVASQYIVPERVPATRTQQSTNTQSHPNIDNDADSDTQSDTSSEEESPLPGNISGAYINLLLSDPKENVQFVECTISTLQFLLLEHVAMPYVGRLFIRPSEHDENNGEEHIMPMSHQANDLTQTVSDAAPQHHVVVRHDDANSARIHHATDPQNERNSQHMPEDRRPTDMQVRRDETDSQVVSGTGENRIRHLQNGTEENTNGGDNQDAVDENMESDLVSDNMLSFTSASMQFHRQYVDAMRNYMVCLHFQEGGRIQNIPQECECVKSLKQSTVALNEINPVLGAFSREFLKLKRPLRVPESSFGSALLDLITYHMEEAENFFGTLRENLPEQCERYWVSFAAPRESSISSITLQGNETSIPETERTTHMDQVLSTNAQSRPQPQPRENNADVSADRTVIPQSHSTEDPAATELREALETGICFPGRRSVRPSIIFKSKDKQSCSKQYNTSKSHSPGLLTVQCACDNPKLIGFVVMTQAESVALALSSILTHFGIPPRAVFYDNACNLFTSVMIRVPWLLGRTRLAVDRFHYKSHKCSAYFNPDSYRQFDMQRTETAESINARIEKSLTSVRYLSGDNLMSFLRVRFALMNLSACFQQAYNRTDVEDEDLTSFFNRLVQCSCDNCTRLQNQPGTNDVTEANNDVPSNENGDQANDADDETEA